jgi:hypothetical protein
MIWSKRGIFVIFINNLNGFWDFYLGIRGVLVHPRHRSARRRDVVTLTCNSSDASPSNFTALQCHRTHGCCTPILVHLRERLAVWFFPALSSCPFHDILLFCPLVQISTPWKSAYEPISLSPPLFSFDVGPSSGCRLTSFIKYRFRPLNVCLQAQNRTESDPLFWVCRMTGVEQPSDHHLTIWEVFSQNFKTDLRQFSGYLALEGFPL